jgi:O-antigen ligase
MAVVRYYWPATTWGHYKTTSFVDPLTFCSYTLLFAILTTVGLTICAETLSNFRKKFLMIAIIIGYYLSITSGARTGWIFLPLFLMAWCIYVIKKEVIKENSVLMIFHVSLLVLLLSTNNQLSSKFILGAHELFSYDVNKINSDTSVGMRISYIRMGIEYILERPLSGWGDLGWIEYSKYHNFEEFATLTTIMGPKHGFHNEILTNSVRSGVWGLASSLLLFLGVFYYSSKGVMNNKLGEQYKLGSMILLVLILHLFITGLSTEVTNLTFLSAFLGILLAVLVGEQENISPNDNYPF